MTDPADRIAAHLDGREPRVLLTLGSGLGGLADEVADPVVMPFADVGLPDTTVPGHAGRLLAGTLRGVPVLCQQGRVHLYEGRDVAEVVAVVEAAAALGVHTFVPTNAAGGIASGTPADPDPGDLMLITDHLNLTGRNPLIGQTAPHFLDMSSAYDPELRAAAHGAADEVGETLREGVYAGLVGPSFETPAEIAYLRTIGAHAVGMSTVCEVIAARAAGLRVAGFSLLTNVHQPGGTPTDHEEVIDVGGQAGPRLARILGALVPRLAESEARA
ncbi:purine-nucleoside phosphorylase [Egibacter rhizosphaerae]|uniref:Purine nucleoside phosphorylase n=1 Tax=Egibacter rhizosphaerae TaxID=1670831 RepID=A0A411YDA5_9ACTN|nr:purine-nucleoside phosphorylase [Egibacter rhizosphaerae]QBI19203.1 purine-nucleoside phosphorylase [Egibacter rhizosphaerae]